MVLFPSGDLVTPSPRQYVGRALPALDPRPGRLQPGSGRARRRPDPDKSDGAAAWWLDTLPDARRCRPWCHDPGEMQQAGLVADGIPCGGYPDWPTWLAKVEAEARQV